MVGRGVLIPTVRRAWRGQVQSTKRDVTSLNKKIGELTTQQQAYSVVQALSAAPPEEVRACASHTLAAIYICIYTSSCSR